MLFDVGIQCGKECFDVGINGTKPHPPVVSQSFDQW